LRRNSVALDPGVLVTWSSASAAALRRQTSMIPIVLVNVIDPVGQSFVESLAHPGGMITGFTDYDPPTAGKWPGMLTQIARPVARAAILYNPTTAPLPV
jgi:putative tryptophan/tyrosine transport system substrate-binding protein